ncbi:hypothetical protein [Streptomyces sp. TE5632]
MTTPVLAFAGERTARQLAEAEARHLKVSLDERAAPHRGSAARPGGPDPGS